MARKRTRKTKPAENPSQLRPRLILGLQLAVPIVLVSAIVFGLVRLGREAGQQLKDDARYSIPFSEIICTPPQTLSRELFLAEVRYLSDMPESISLIDPQTEARLRDAFQMHPWVEAVESIQVTVDRQLHLNLRYRVPVLVIPVQPGPQSVERAIDSHAVLLPVFEIPKSVPRLIGIRPVPAVSSGQRLRDPLVQRALDLTVEFSALHVEYREANWRITRADGRVFTVKQ